MKTCTRCKVEKPKNEFGIKKTGSDKLRCYCKKCSSELIKIYKEENKEKIDKSRKKYRIENADKIKQYDFDNSDRKKQYKMDNKEHINKKNNEYVKNRKLTDPFFKLKCTIRTCILNSIRRKNYTKKSKTYEILGCSYEDFKTHLENKFTDGMSWENQGKWHLDHIIPISSAKTESELIKLNHYTNFQPLWAIDNRIKSNKY